MSDDTPTQKFPSAGDGDVPTQRIDTAPVTELGEERKKSRGLLVGLIAAGALLLIAVIVLIVILTSNASGQGAVTASPQPTVATPTPSETPSETPSASPTAEPTDDPVTPAVLTVDSFTVSPSTWTCNSSAPNPVPDPVLEFTWRTSNAEHVYFAVGAVPDAESQGQGWDLPEDGNQEDFPDGASFTFNCPAASQSYTLTAVDGQGHRVTRTVTVTNNGDTQ
jgi:cytoskeletal protein RodZ